MRFFLKLHKLQRIRLAEPVGKGITDPVVYPAEDLGVDLPDMAKSPSDQEVPIAVEILGLLKVSEDIIFFIDKGGVESPGPKGDIGKGMFPLVRIIVEVIDPGTVHGPHPGDKIVDRQGAEPIFAQGVLHPVFPHPELVYIGKGIRHQFQGHTPETSVRDLNRKGFMLIGRGIDKLDAVQDGLVAVVVPGDVHCLAR